MNRTSVCIVFVLLAACEVAPPPPSTGGFSFAGGAPEGGTDSGTDGGVACGRGVLVVMSDYMSTNVAVSSLDGVTKSSSFVSSGATRPGLSLALSGDVDVPFVAPASGRVVVIDRAGTNVLTWLNLDDASVIAQLPVGTGFESNPHDYLEVDARRAYLTRYGTNPTPGQQPFDQGGDLLILDTSSFAVTGRVALLEEDPALQPCPDGMTWLGAHVVVNLQRFAADFSAVGDGRFVGVSPATNTVDWTVDVAGLQNCGRLALSPSGKLAAIACSGKEDVTTGQFDPARSDIVVYDATATPPRELRRLSLGTTLNAAIQPAIAFATEDAIFATTYGGNAAPGDSVFAASATTGAVTALGQETQPFVFGAVRCAPGCGDVCLLTDARSSTLKRWQVAADGGFVPLSDETVDQRIGLPPRTLGGL